MTISQTQLDRALSEEQLPKFWLGYFQEAFREDTQQQLLEIFEHLKESVGFSRSDLARKIGRRPEQVTRWLSAPTNLETDTVSDIALGMGYVPKLSFVSVHALVGTHQQTNHGNATTGFVHMALASSAIGAVPLGSATISGGVSGMPIGYVGSTAGNDIPNSAVRVASVAAVAAS